MNFFYSLGLLNGIIGDIIKKIVEPIKEWFSNLLNGILEWFGRAIYGLLVTAVGKVVDVCQLLFRKFAGLDSVKYDGAVIEGDIVLAFINSAVVKKVFFALLALAVVLLLITTFVAVIKTEFTANNSKKGIIKDALKAIANFAIVPIVAIFGLIVGNALLRAIDGATSLNNQATISSQIFLVGSYNSNRARKSEKLDSNGNVYYPNGSFGYILTGSREGENKGGSGYGNFNIFYDDANDKAGTTAADKIDLAFSTNLTLNLKDSKIEVGNDEIKFNGITNDKQMYLNAGDHPAYYGGMFFPSYIENLNRDGDVEEHMVFSIYNIELVFYYYGTGITQFDYIPCVIALLYCAYTLIITLISLIKRLFMLTTLFIVSPPICAMYPLDGGKALGRWRTSFIKEAIGAYSIVVVMNLFFILLPLFMKIEVFTAADVARNSIVKVLTLGGAGIGIKFLNYCGRILITLAALAFFKKGSSVIAEIIGGADLRKDGADDVKGFTTGALKVGAGLALGAGAVRGAARFTGNVIGGSAKMVRGAAGAVRENGFGGAVKGLGNKIADKVAGPGDEITGKRHWITGTVKNAAKGVGSVGHAAARGTAGVGHAFGSVLRADKHGKTAGESLSNAFHLGSTKKGGKGGGKGGDVGAPQESGFYAGRGSANYSLETKQQAYKNQRKGVALLKKKYTNSKNKAKTEYNAKIKEEGANGKVSSGRKREIKAELNKKYHVDSNKKALNTSKKNYKDTKAGTATGAYKRTEKKNANKAAQADAGGKAKKK